MGRYSSQSSRIRGGAVFFDADRLDCVNLDEVVGIVTATSTSTRRHRLRSPGKNSSRGSMAGRRTPRRGALIRQRRAAEPPPIHGATHGPVAPICVCLTSQSFGDRSEICRPVWTRRPKGQESCEQKCPPRILQGRGVMSPLNEATRKTKIRRIQKRRPRGACPPHGCMCTTCVQFLP